MKESDLPAVREIEINSFSNPWSDMTFRGEIQNRGFSFPLVIVHDLDRKIIGYIIYWQIRDEAQINNVAVHSDYRGKGIGEAALRLVLQEVREKGVHLVTLEVRPSNTPALSLYRKLGFRIIGERKGYYSRPDEDACVMGLFFGADS